LVHLWKYYFGSRCTCRNSKAIEGHLYDQLKLFLLRSVGLKTVSDWVESICYRDYVVQDMDQEV